MSKLFNKGRNRCPVGFCQAIITVCNMKLLHIGPESFKKPVFVVSQELSVQLPRGFRKGPKLSKVEELLRNYVVEDVAGFASKRLRYDSN